MNDINPIILKGRPNQRRVFFHAFSGAPPELIVERESYEDLGDVQIVILKINLGKSTLNSSVKSFEHFYS
jgi:hypothetical protein